MDFVAPRDARVRATGPRSGLRLVGSSVLAGAALLLIGAAPVAAAGPLGEALDTVVEVADSLGTDELVGEVGEAIEPVVEPAQPALETVGSTLHPVTGPILEPLEPVVDELEPVLELLEPGTDPIGGPILDSDAPPAAEFPELPILSELPILGELAPTPGGQPNDGPRTRDGGPVTAPPLLAIDAATDAARQVRSATPAAPPASVVADRSTVAAESGLAAAPAPAAAADEAGVPRIGLLPSAAEPVGSLVGGGMSLVWAAALVVFVLPLVRSSRLIALTLTLPSGRLVLTPAPPG